MAYLIKRVVLPANASMLILSGAELWETVTTVKRTAVKLTPDTCNGHAVFICHNKSSH